MGRHIRWRDPRAHWVLLLLALAVLLAALGINGYVRHMVGAAGTPPPALVGGPAAVTSGGPVLHVAGDRVDSRRLPPRTVALTFDDGPDPVWTPRILDVLARYHAHATFFVVGERVNENPALVRRIVAAGHEVGSHTYSHADVAALPAWRRNLEITLTDNAIAGAAGVRTRLFRPPYSSEPDAVSARDWPAYAAIARSGYLLALADLDGRDWARPGVPEIVKGATPQAGAGAVILLHDGGGDRAQTVAALEQLLPALARRGYRFTTLSEALALPGTSVRADLPTRLRGTALRWAQLAAERASDVLTWLLTVGLGLGLLRVVAQLYGASVHRRRIRRRRRLPPVYDPVSVIVPAYNEAANIAATIRSLLASTHPYVEVIVVDDGSTDDTADIAERFDVRVIRQANAGKPAALNTGIRYARADLLVLVDGDTVFEPETIHRLVQPFADRRVGAISGNTKVANRRGLLGRWQHLEYVIGFNLDRRLFDVAQCMPTVPGAIGAFRRAAVRHGIATDTLAEDTDLTMEVGRAGWRVVYEESARAWTEVPSTLRQLWRQRYRWCYGTLQAMWKHRGALVSRGQAGKLGRRGLGYLLLFQTLLPLAAPAVDVFAIYGLVFLDPWKVAGAWLGFLCVQMMMAGYALRMDRERLGPLWTLPLQQVVYRQLMYLVTIQSVVTAVLGTRLRWQRMHRTGQAAALVGRPPDLQRLR